MMRMYFRGYQTLSLTGMIEDNSFIPYKSKENKAVI